MSKQAQYYIGKPVLWTESAPGKPTKRVLDRIASVNKVTITLQNNKDVSFSLSGNRYGLTDSTVSKIVEVSEAYADELRKMWADNDEKQKIIDNLIENRDLLFILPLNSLQRIESEFLERRKRIRLE